jgi:hypothetical protein
MKNACCCAASKEMKHENNNKTITQQKTPTTIFSVFPVGEVIHLLPFALQTKKGARKRGNCTLRES